MGYRIGFIGAGNMAGALIAGAIKSGIMPTEIGISDIDQDRLDAHAKTHNYHVAQNNTELTKYCDIIVLAVKPVYAASVLHEISGVLDGKALVSIVAGLNMDRLRNLLPKNRLLRIMPNMPAAVGAGTTLICHEHTLTANEFEFMQNVLDGAGKCFMVSEAMLESATAISGSGPAYAFMFIEAMADAAVLWGIPRRMAYSLAAQTLLGAAEMVLQTGQHPAQLKDAVCSPGGMTIEAVCELENHGFRSSIIEAINVCTKKGLQMQSDNKNTSYSPINNNTQPESADSNKVEIYADGACSGNPGPGGWGVILQYGSQEKEMSGYEAATTNNRMELMAALIGLQSLTMPCEVILYSDSAYLVDAFNKNWLPKWQRNGWKTSDGKDVLNKDLWVNLLEETKRHKVVFNKVRGHSSNERNNRCDKLARQEISKNERILDER